jgi:hypothetical protein
MAQGPPGVDRDEGLGNAKKQSNNVRNGNPGISPVLVQQTNAQLNSTATLP